MFVMRCIRIVFFFLILQLTSAQQMERLPITVLILNKSCNSSLLANVQSIASKLTDIRDTVYLQNENACADISSVKAAPGELILYLTSDPQEVGFCNPKVYGPLPSVLQIRATETKKKKEDFLTLQLSTHGGVSRFDVETGRKESANNVEVALKSVLVIAAVSPPFKNKLPAINRESMFLLDDQITLLERDLRKVDKEESAVTSLLLPLVFPLYIYAAALGTLILINCQRHPHESAHYTEFTIGADTVEDNTPKKKSRKKHRGVVLVKDLKARQAGTMPNTQSFSLEPIAPNPADAQTPTTPPGTGLDPNNPALNTATPAGTTEGKTQNTQNIDM